MKNIFLLLGILASSLSFLQAQQPDTKNAEAFLRTQALLESGQFYVEADRAYPSGGRTVDLFSNRGYMTVKDSVADGFFPFFGRAYSAPIGNEGGIEFDSPMEKINLVLKNKKKNKHLLYSFRVRGNNDTYDIFLDVSAGGSCTVSIRSNRKSQISYSGEVRTLPAKTSEP